MGGIVVVLLREHRMLWNTGGKIKLKIYAGLVDAWIW